jgi:orotidine-5'-phosphate decarboxylase
MSYLDKLGAIQAKNRSWLCIGLDPQPERLPLEATRWDEPVLPFNKVIIDHTADLVCAYKPNLGFYLQWGAAGVIALERTIAYIPDHIPVILDCKIGDIQHTQSAWGKGLFDLWGVDAITVNPYAGAEAILPLITNRPEKAVYILARTSNPGAALFQGDLAAKSGLAAEVVRESQRWMVGARQPAQAAGARTETHPVASPVQQEISHCGYVVGATYPAELAAARELAPTANFLIPGVGAQGGELAAAVRYGPDAVAGPVINASRSILYASSGLDFAEAARASALSLRDEINTLRQPMNKETMRQ